MVFFMNALSLDLRVRVISYIDLGHSVIDASIRFFVSAKSIRRWLKLREQTGSLEAIPTPRSPHKLHDKDLLEYVEYNPDAYLREIAAHRMRY